MVTLPSQHADRTAPTMGDRTRANGAIIGVANVDSTEEIQVMTADYAPEYGRAAGGQIRIVSKVRSIC